LIEEKLRILPQREHLVGILHRGSSPELRVFQKTGITQVIVSPNLEFPEEVFAVFDLLAFEGSLWETIDQRLHQAIETYVKSGGTVYISDDTSIPSISGSSSWGMGRHYVPSARDRHMLRLPAMRDRVKERILEELGLSGSRRTRRLSRSESAEIFEPLPRHLGSRASWAVYLTVCLLTIAAAALCGILRLWSRRFNIILMPALSVGLSVGFLIVVPGGSVAYERVSLTVAASNSDVALRCDYIQLYGFADSGRERHEFGIEGFIVPARPWYTGLPGAGWRRRRERTTPLHLHNGKEAGVSDLSLPMDGSAVFEVSRHLRIDGGFDVIIRKDASLLVNNSGLDLNDCVLVSSGMVTELGTVHFGQTVELSRLDGEFIERYLQRRYDDGTHRGRVLGSFAEMCWKKCFSPGGLYLVSWTRENSEAQGYAQVTDFGNMWIVEIGAYD
jgi:hypothetical protein